MACFPAILSGGALAIKEQVAVAVSITYIFLHGMDSARSKGDSRSNSRAGRGGHGARGSGLALCGGYGGSSGYGSKGK